MSMIYTPKEFCENLIRKALNIEMMAEHLPESCAACIVNGYYKEMVDHDKKPFTSFKQFCEYRLPYGMALKWDVLLKLSENTKYREIILAQEVIDEPLAQHGEIGNGRDESRGDIITSTLRGTSPSYILRRLARDGAEDASKAALFKQVTKGEISAHKAALVAGYRTKKTPLEQVKKIIDKLTLKDLKVIERWIQDRRSTP